MAQVLRIAEANADRLPRLWAHTIVDEAERD